MIVMTMLTIVPTLFVYVACVTIGMSHALANLILMLTCTTQALVTFHSWKLSNMIQSSNQ